MTNETVKALAHPVRRDIIIGVSEGLDSPTALADEYELPLGVVAYHVRMLRDYGVLEVARTEPRRGALQHFYRFTAEAEAEFETVRALAVGAIRSARHGRREAMAA